MRVGELLLFDQDEAAESEGEGAEESKRSWVSEERGKLVP